MSLSRFKSAAAAVLVTLGLASQAVAADPAKIGFVYIGPTGDHGWTYAHDQGRKAVEAKFGDKVKTTFVENVPETADAERVFRDLAQQGYKMIFATSFNWLPNDVPGNTVVMPPPVPALFSIAFSDIAFDITEFACCTSVSPLLNVSISCNAAFFASAADCGQKFIPPSDRSKPGTRLADCTVLPVQNNAGPAIDTDEGNVAAPFIACTASASRPAQPVPAPELGTPLCICVV